MTTLVQTHEELLRWWAIDVAASMWAAAAVVDDKLRALDLDVEERDEVLDELVSYALGLAEDTLPEILAEIVDREPAEVAS
jgi:hypothetical protein